MSIVSRVLLFFAIVSSLTSCQSYHLVAPSEMDILGFGSYIDQEMPKLLSEKFPGAQIALVEKGRTVYEKGFGTSDLKSQESVSTDTVFQVASLSKTVTAWAILKLAQEGKIDLDAPIWNYVHRWKLPPSTHNAERISIRSVLSHRGGLSLVGFPGYAPGERIPTSEESLSGDNGVIYGFFRMGPLFQQDEAWAKFSYSGGGYTLLQLVIEEVSGQSFSSFMREEILDPLGMTHSSFDYDEAKKFRISKAYSSSGSELPNYLFVEKAAAGLYTTAGDLAVLLNELYLLHSDSTRDSRVLSKEYARLFYTENPQVKDGYDVFGYFRAKEDGMITSLYHGGNNQGWKAFYLVDIPSGKGFVFLTNSDTGSEVIAEFGKVFNKNVLKSSVSIAMGL